LIDQLVAHADFQYREGNARVMRTALKLYGVRVPDLRQIARDWRAAHRGISTDAMLRLIDALWNGASYEERALAIFILSGYPRVLTSLTQETFDRWRTLIDNWGLCDGLATGLLGPWIQADAAERLDYLRTLIGSDDVWSRRLALVGTASINRGRSGPTIPDLTFDLIDAVKVERHPMITKAVSWALREMTKTQRDRVAAYIEANRDVLAPLVVREVSNKLRTGLKSGRERTE